MLFHISITMMGINIYHLSIGRNVKIMIAFKFYVPCVRERETERDSPSFFLLVDILSFSRECCTLVDFLSAMFKYIRK